MVGIAGMLAKRSQKKVGAEQCGAAASSTQPAPTTGSDLANDDVFAPFGDRPSTAASYEDFGNVGGFMDDFDNFGGVGDSGIGTDSVEIDDDQNQVPNATAASNTASCSGESTDSGSMQQNLPGGLKMFMKRSSASKEIPLSVVPSEQPVAPLPAVQQSTAAAAAAAAIVHKMPSILPSSSSNLRSFIDKESSPMDDSFMPPPPRRRPSMSPPNESSFVVEAKQLMMLEDDLSLKDQGMEAPLMAETISSCRYEECFSEKSTVEPTIAQRSSRAIDNNFSPQAVLNRHTTPTAGLPAPKVVFQTPKTHIVRGGGGRNTSVVEASPPMQTGFRFSNVSSLESLVLPSSTTPPSSNAICNQQKPSSRLQTPFLTSNVDNHLRVPITPDSHLMPTRPEVNNHLGEEPFDDMFCAVLEYVQAIKDKNHVSEEQMLDMEVQLEHVIATMNFEMLQMQQMEEELDKIQRSQEGTVTMYRS